MFENIPKDPVMLLSFINLKLRDYYPSLDELCASLSLDSQDIIEKLATIDYEYDADSNQYFRYMNQKGKMVPYVDRDTQEKLAFANVIVQHTKVTYNGSYAAPVTEHIGEGNADFFMGGVHIAGYWKRDDMASRTVFYGPDGNEIELQRGTTFVSIIPTETKVSYE